MNTKKQKENATREAVPSTSNEEKFVNRIDKTPTSVTTKVSKGFVYLRYFGFTLPKKNKIDPMKILFYVSAKNIDELYVNKLYPCIV